MADKIPVYVFESPDDLLPDDAKNIWQSWEQAVEGTVLQNARLVILEGGQRIRALSPDAQQLPKAVDILEQHGMPELAAWFRGLTEGRARIGQKPPRPRRTVIPNRGTPARGLPNRGTPNRGR